MNLTTILPCDIFNSKTNPKQPSKLKSAEIPESENNLLSDQGGTVSEFQVFLPELVILKSTFHKFPVIIYTNYLPGGPQIQIL